jgi:tetratricopeptide (TPR) repeat protein
MTTPMTIQAAPANLIDFSRTLSALNKNGQCREALAFFKAHQGLFTKAELAGNPFLVAGVLNALRGSQRPQALTEGIQFLAWCGLLVDDRTPEAVQTALAWLLYRDLREQMRGTQAEEIEEQDDLVTATEPAPNQDAWQRTAIALLPLLQKGTSSYTANAFSFLFNALLKREKLVNNPNWHWVVEVCTAIDYTLLSKECSKMEVQQRGQTRQIELASDLENYYAYKSKALLKLGNTQECLSVVNEGLATVEKFHYNNDAWLARRMALCLKAQGNYTQAIFEIQLILSRKDEWFIRKELAELLFETGALNEAIPMAASAMTMHGDLEYKIGLLYQMGCMLMQQGDHERAALHFQLSYLVRQSQGWSIPDMITQAMLSCREYLRTNATVEDLFAHLKLFWQSFAPAEQASGTDRLEGSIQKILHQNERGVNGFITYAEGQTIYFTMPVHHPAASTVKVGMEVSFSIFPAREEGKKPTAGKLKILKKNHHAK